MVWVIGSKGMLGSELCRMLEAEKIPFTGTDREVSIIDKDALAAFSAAKKPAFIINCSGYTAVDKAEEDESTAFAVNRDGVAVVAELAGKLDIPLLHISTDYVFPGTSPRPLDETAETGPAGVYGKSKLAGEEAVRELCPKHYIVRTAWLYGQYGPNFVYTMLKLMNTHESIKVVNDQHGSPTWTKDLASFITHIIKTESTNYGPYHFPEKLIPLIIKNILEGKKLPVYGDGRQVRDWLYVEDHCKGIDLVINNGRPGEAYNIGGFNEEENINIVKQTIDILRELVFEGKTVKPQYRDFVTITYSECSYDLITYVQDRLGHDARYAIDPAKTVEELGFYPETPFTEGISKTIQWYLDNQWWVAEVASGDYQKYYNEMYGNR